MRTKFGIHEKEYKVIVTRRHSKAKWSTRLWLLPMALGLIFLFGCGVFRREQRNESPTASSVRPAATQAVPTVTQVAPETATRVAPPPTRTNPPVSGGPTLAPTPIAPSPAVNTSQTHFGVQVVVQAGNAPNSLPSPAYLQSLHVETTIVWIYYPGTGENANAWIDTEKQLVEKMIAGTGLKEIGVHIMPNPRPGTGGVGPRFHMPADLNAYSAALTGLAKALQPYVRYYSIGNEFSVNIWEGTIADYATLLKVSGQAIKAGNPNALIVDSGMAGQNYVYPIGQAMLQAGNSDGAIKFVQAFLQHASIPLPTNESQLKAALGTKDAQGALGWFQALFTSLCPYYDVYQLHDYQGGATLQTVYDWIHSQMQANHCVKPIQAWELGYSLDPSVPIDNEDQARNTAQIVTVSVAEGAQLVNYFPLRTFDMFRGIATNDLQLLPAGIAFQTATGKLIGISQATRLSLGNNVTAFEFAKGANKIYVVWSSANASLKLPFQGGATVTDILGKATRISSNDISVGASPVFVEP